MIRRSFLRIIPFAIMMLIAITGVIGVLSRSGVLPLNAEASKNSRHVYGEYNCLPPRDDTGISTYECRYGIHTDDGLWYALDMTSLTDIARDSFEIGDQIWVRGTVTPSEQIEASGITLSYDIAGVITVYKISQQIPTATPTIRP